MATSSRRMIGTVPITCSFHRRDISHASVWSRASLERRPLTSAAVDWSTSFISGSARQRARCTPRVTCSWPNAPVLHVLTKTAQAIRVGGCVAFMSVLAAESVPRLAGSVMGFARRTEVDSALIERYASRVTRIILVANSPSELPFRAVSPMWTGRAGIEWVGDQRQMVGQQKGSWPVRRCCVKRRHFSLEWCCPLG